ncbi:hypothetical protein HOLleu_38115 [Holothuria leucospilota]|uniref:Reverse transcriptase domain-containing protein n=1 Tax=Holothuria leucospilota TaxID=206669 RepID=A0A9Q1BF93_HOLLE|nr:hypothetical protein HOLleu_38115 [Holothuria leucospilota]
MSNNKSPGLDVYPMEFFKYFWNDLGDYIRRALNDCYKTGSFSVILSRGVITLIPKPNKDKRYLKHWRRITLLTVIYKLASSCVANKMKRILASDQKGFFKGRFIGENIRLLNALYRIQYSPGAFRLGRF